MTQELPGVPARKVVSRLEETLSVRSRVRAVVALVAGLAGAVFVTTLWWSEPGPLPARTHGAFALFTVLCLAWAGYGVWLLRRRVPLFATDRVVAAWIGVVASFATGVLLVVVIVHRGGTGAWGAGLVSAALVAVATVLLVRARRQRAVLLRRERELVRRDSGTQ